MDVLLLLLFFGVAGYGVHWYFTGGAEQRPQADLELVPENKSFINLKTLLERAKIVSPASIQNTWLPSKLSNRWQYIAVHHSATTGGTISSIEKEDLKSGMENGLAYHFVIGNGRGIEDGKVEIGKRWKEQLDGGHVKGEDLNKVSIGICLIGDFTIQMPTVKQVASLKALLNYLLNVTNINESRVLSHAKMPSQATLCPGVLPVKVIVKHREVNK